MGRRLDCGSGLLLLIRKHIDPLEPGQLLEILSTEASVEEDLPSWCRLTGNQLVNFVKDGRRLSFLVSKGAFAEPAAVPDIVLTGKKKRPKGERRQAPITQPVVTPTIPDVLPAPAAAPALEPLAIRLFGAERVLLNPDCGFATFADNPIVGPDLAEAKLAALVQARDVLRHRHPNLG